MSNLTIDVDVDFPLLMPKWGYVASAFVLFLIGFFGFFLNLMVIVLMIKDRQLWTPLNTILFNLVTSDFCVSFMGNPLTLISALFRHWVFGVIMCKLYGFFMALLGISSITSLTLLSFERYIMVTRPLSAPRSTGTSILMIVFIWTYSLILTTPPLFGWGNYVSEAANISCSVNWHEQSNNTITYILFLFTFGQLVPFSIISFSYIHILRTIRKNSKRAGQVGRAETRVTIMVFVMIIAFAVAWTPYSVFALIEQFGEKGTISPGLGVIPALVAKSSICYDPLIYIGMNSQFRDSIRRLFRGKPKPNMSLTEKGPDNGKTTKKEPRPNSSDSNVSSQSKKQIIVLEQIIIPGDRPSITIEKCDSPFLDSSTKRKLQKGRTDKFEESLLIGDSGTDGLETMNEESIHDDSSVLKIIDQDHLVFKRDMGAFTNDGLDLAVETITQDRDFGEMRWSSSSSGMLQSCLSDKAENETNVDSIVETTSESKYTTGRYSLIKRTEENDNII